MSEKYGEIIKRGSEEWCRKIEADISELNGRIKVEQAVDRLRDRLERERAKGETVPSCRHCGGHGLRQERCPECSRVDKRDECPTCKSTGVVPPGDHDGVTCFDCRGSGIAAPVPPPPPDAVERVARAVCLECGGSGEIITKSTDTEVEMAPCPKCGTIEMEKAKRLADSRHAFPVPWHEFCDEHADEIIASLRAATGQPETGRGEIGDDWLPPEASPPQEYHELSQSVRARDGYWRKHLRTADARAEEFRERHRGASIACIEANARADKAEARAEEAEKYRDECERQYQAKVDELGREITRAQEAEAARDEAEKKLNRVVCECNAAKAMGVTHHEAKTINRILAEAMPSTAARGSP